MHRRDRAALPYRWRRRLEAWIIRHGIGIHRHNVSLRAAQKDTLPAGAERDMLRVHRDQGDAQTQYTRS
jgi:hypothetical protein